ncbi:MAG: hypothetical protein SPE84_01555 [Bullifex sp.]|nr:hypothetical protein [Bullifex sp.]
MKTFIDFLIRHGFREITEPVYSIQSYDEISVTIEHEPDERTFSKKWLTVSVCEDGTVTCSLLDKNSYPYRKKKYSGRLSEIHDDAFVLTFRREECFGEWNALSSSVVTEGKVEISVPEG